MLRDGIGGGAVIMSRTDFARACLLAADMGIDAGAALFWASAAAVVPGPATWERILAHLALGRDAPTAEVLGELLRLDMIELVGPTAPSSACDTFLLLGPAEEEGVVVQVPLHLFKVTVEVFWREIRGEKRFTIESVHLAQEIRPTHGG